MAHEIHSAAGDHPVLTVLGIQTVLSSEVLFYISLIPLVADGNFSFLGRTCSLSSDLPPCPLIPRRMARRGSGGDILVSVTA